MACAITIDENVSGRVELESKQSVVIACAEIGRKDERRTFSGKFSHKAVILAGENRLHHSRGRREISRICFARDERVSVGIDRDHGRRVVICTGCRAASLSSADQCGVNQRRSRRIQFRDERVRPACVNALKCSERSREIRRLGFAGHETIPGRVHRDRRAEITG